MLFDSFLDWVSTFLFFYFCFSLVVYGCEILGIEFAPLGVPWERRMQTLVVWSMGNQFLVMPIVCIFAYAFLFTTRYWPACIIYAFWMCYDRRTCEEGGRVSPRLRNANFWRHYMNYFPITLHKTAALDPTKRYIAGYHPHGVLPYANASLRIKESGYKEMFPGINFKTVTLAMNWWIPFHREIITALGFCSVDRKSIEYMLTKEPLGTAIILMVGGAQEALDAVPGTMKLTLRNRKGFVRLALQHGASLLPVLSFGENDTYNQVNQSDDSKLKKIQGFFTHFRGFSIPLMRGRGIFQYTFGYVPFRRPINVVVGAPIDVSQLTKPSKEDVDHFHEKYIAELQRMFDDNKHKYMKDPSIQLLIK